MNKPMNKLHALTDCNGLGREVFDEAERYLARLEHTHNPETTNMMYHPYAAKEVTRKEYDRIERVLSIREEDAISEYITGLPEREQLGCCEGMAW